MRRYLLSAAVLAMLTGGSVAYAQDATSTGVSVRGPIAELGNCASRAECKAYCDLPSHVQACIGYAESHGLMSSAEAATARKFAGQTGPGGCMGSQCREYCGAPGHQSECAQFAQAHGLTPPGGSGGPKVEVSAQKEARIQQVLAAKGGPGGCTSKESCMAYCSDSSHQQECVAFAKDNGLMSEQEADRAQKLISQTGPGGCRGEECRTYCDDPSHRDECLTFAQKQGFITPEQASTTRALGEISGPGGCTGEECKTFCDDPSHRGECIKFANEHGITTRGGPPEEVGGAGGPGGCTSREECASFCQKNPDACQGSGPPGQDDQGPPPERQGPPPWAQKNDNGENRPQRLPQESGGQYQQWKGPPSGPQGMPGARGEARPPKSDDRHDFVPPPAGFGSGAPKDFQGTPGSGQSDFQGPPPAGERSSPPPEAGGGPGAVIDALLRFFGF